MNVKFFKNKTKNEENLLPPAPKLKETIKDVLQKIISDEGWDRGGNKGHKNEK